MFRTRRGHEWRHRAELHDELSLHRLASLRAAVLGANDGIISIAGLVVAIASSTTERSTILTAAMAGILAGAISMALGEYVSVSSQRDGERAILAQEQHELDTNPEAELKELAGIYEGRGLSPRLAEAVAIELHANDALAAHASAELRIDPNQLTDPWKAAGASSGAFLLGAIVPALAVMLTPPSWRVPAVCLAVLPALILTGALSAYAGMAKMGPAITRILIGGAAALAFSIAIGRLFGSIVG